MVSLKPAYEMGLSILRVLSNAITGIVLVRMLKEIAHLNDAELQSLVPWNRLLVYAALYGVADQVTKVMKLRNIHLENQALNAFVYTPFYHDVTHQVMPCLLMDRQHRQLVISQFPLVVEEVSLAEEAEEALVPSK